MKLHRLDLTGFGPFRETQTVDFDAFDADGVFLITGRTGAGKSSILDGVSFALYGAVPRYEGGERRLRSDHCFLGDPTEVRLEFTVGPRRWRVTRAPEYDRPAKRGGGLTTEPTRAHLEEHVDGAWVGRAAKPREVGILLDEEIGLNAQQFQQVILLAQNKFSRFLLAANDERQALLRTLFGTRRFEKYTNDLEQRRRDAQKEQEAGDAQIATLLTLVERLIDTHDLEGAGNRPDSVTDRRAAAARALQRAEYRHDTAWNNRGTAEAAARNAAAALAVATAYDAAVTELEGARVVLSRLEAESPRIDADRRRLARAQHAETLRATVDAADRAAASHTDAVEASARAQAAWRAAGGADDLDAAIEKFTGDLALWAAAAERERLLIEAEQTVAVHADELRVLSEAVVALDDDLAHLPSLREQLDADLAVLSVRAQRADELRTRRATLSPMIEATVQAAELARSLRAAEEDYARDSAAAAAATEAVTSLLQRRLAGYAGELALALSEGEPCAVCGSAVHPHPATPTDDPVTADDLAAAEVNRDHAAQRAAGAGDRARSARDAHADAAARSGGRPLADLEEDARTCDEELREAEAAAVRVAGLVAERGELDVRVVSVQRDRAEKVADRDRIALEHAASVRTVTDLRAEISAARGEFSSVAARVAHTAARRDIARAAAGARDALTERLRTLTDALADRDARIAASDFADESEVMGALLDPQERTRLDERITAHTGELAAIRSRLLTLELDVLEAPPTDLATARQAATDADTARAAAIAAERDAHNAMVRLRDLLLDVEAAAGSTATLAEEAAVVSRLADTVAGRAPNTMKMELETFVLAAELEEIVAAANLRLTEMSAGRYTLHHSDARAARGRASGLAIEVLDAYTGRLRSPQSLSGGETFLASLALALGLAEVVTSRAGGIRLDTLFVDEGFGSLDPETLELAMRTLDELRAGGRTVGVISHVEAMKEQLPAQVTVEAAGQGPSTIRQNANISR
ncbi:SMC family ATPase [uncultured Microbacterium sp.]|uniref:AAA family ATPase n=1 Tax=uncultured Microbacterium sp. TaxID=191216 RepID=UPI00262CAE8E|nr:SMC family ATPase [uncultured Microbacterium sp.]